MKAKAKKLTGSQPRGLILSLLFDFLDNDDERALSFFDHIGFDLACIRDIKELPDAFLGHYRLKRGVYDVDRAFDDLSTWPPIASRIVELMNEERKRETLAK